MSIVLHFVFFALSPSNFYSCLSLPMNDSSSHRTHRRPMPRPIVPAIAPNDATPPPASYNPLISTMSVTHIFNWYKTYVCLCFYFINTSIFIYLPGSVQINLSICASTQPPSHPATHRSVCLLIRRSVLPFIQSSMHSFRRPPTYLPVRILSTYPLIYSSSHHFPPTFDLIYCMPSYHLSVYQSMC